MCLHFGSAEQPCIRTTLVLSHFGSNLMKEITWPCNLVIMGSELLRALRCNCHNHKRSWRFIELGFHTAPQQQILDGACSSKCRRSTNPQFFAAGRLNPIPKVHTVSMFTHAQQLCSDHNHLDLWHLRLANQCFWSVLTFAVVNNFPNYLSFCCFYFNIHHHHHHIPIIKQTKKKII